MTNNEFQPATHKRVQNFEPLQAKAGLKLAGITFVFCNNDIMLERIHSEFDLKICNALLK